MSSNIDTRQAYINGIESYRNNDYKNARYWFQLSYQDDNYREQVLANLIKIDIVEGKFSKARDILNANKDTDSPRLKQVYGLLENVENNFEESKRYYSECMATPNMQYKSLLALAKLYVQTGDYDIAEKMYHTIKLNCRFYVQTMMDLICLYILEKDFYKAQQYLRKIDEAQLLPKQLRHYKILNAYVSYFLGQLNDLDNYDIENDYMIYRLLHPGEEALLAHIERHKNQEQKMTNGCFFKYIDTKKLLDVSYDIIQNMNPNHFEISDMYRFRLDSPIGYKGEEITSDLCVVSTIGTKDIVTMYPVALSEEFDKEGFSTKQFLKAKRLQGGRKNG